MDGRKRTGGITFNVRIRPTQKTLTYFLCQFISLCLLSVSMLFTSFSRNEGTELAAVAAHNAAFYFRRMVPRLFLPLKVEHEKQ